MTLRRKDLLGIRELDFTEINLILDSALSFKEVLGRNIKKIPTLRGKTVINLFYEPSTRTRTSFEIAGKILSADVINFSTSTSSVKKGESFVDTSKNLAAMKPDVIVLRHSAAGAPHILAKMLDVGVINAGDGYNEHPTQALLDLMTIREHKNALDGLKVVIIGDINHSRVARSNIYSFQKFNMNITVSGPKTLIPPGLERLGVNVETNLFKALEGADIVMALRLQLERQSQGLFPSTREFAALYGINNKKLENVNKDCIIMHPGPLNRGIEIDPEVADGPHSVILDQVTNGVAVRMALLYLFTGGIKERETTS
jgi:aspartate carbamoyltransferase catalytic subunit